MTVSSDTPAILIVEPGLNLYRWLKAPIRTRLRMAEILHTSVVLENTEFMGKENLELVILDCAAHQQMCLDALQSLVRKRRIPVLVLLDPDDSGNDPEEFETNETEFIPKTPDCHQAIRKALIPHLNFIHEKYQPAGRASFYRELIENASECIYFLDSDGNVRLVNRAASQLTSYPIDELMGKHFSAFFAKAEYDNIIRRFEKSKMAPPKTNLRTQILTKTNGSIPVELNVIPVERNGKRIGFQGIVRDIRAQIQSERDMARRSEEIEQMNLELVEKNQQLQELNKLKSHFLSAVSHELRTPLNAILGYAGLLQEELYGRINESQNNALKNIVDSGDHLLKLINELLDFARIHKGGFQLYRESHSVRDIVEAAAATIRPSIEEKKVAFIKRLEGELPLLFIDAQKVYQVLLNLLSNAIKFTDSGEVELSVYRKNNLLEFAVRDTGIGISQEDVNKIFEDFYQVDGSATRTYGGTGLGLSLAKHLVQLHGGDIWVNSEPGNGSTFYFSLPIDQTIDSDEESADLGSHKESLREGAMMDESGFIE